MRRLSEADGQRILSRDSAEEVGRVRHVVIDAAARRIVAIHVDGKKKKAQLVDWSAVTGFGPDAVIIDSERSLRPPSEGDELAIASGKLDLEGRRVLSEGGDALGAVRDIEFDESSGELQAIVTGDSSHDGALLHAIGPYCVILRDAPRHEESLASPRRVPSE